MAFPNCNCYVCREPMMVNDSMVVGGSYKRHIDYKLEEYGTVEDLVENEPIVNMLTFHYLYQFQMRDLKKEPNDGGPRIINLFDGINDILEIRSNHKYRFEVVQPQIPLSKYLYLTIHNDCRFDGAGHYEIPLSRINDASKALEWTFHLDEKTTFNPHGWIETMESLFGRRGV